MPRTKKSAATRSAAIARTQRPSRQQRVALAVLAGALGLDIGSLNIANAALPAIAASFRLDEASLQWVTTAYAAAFAALLLLGGRLADVVGRRRIFMCGVLVYTVAAVLATVAPTAALLILARAGQGAGAALSGPAALGLLTEVFTATDQRRRAYAVYAAVGAASGSVGFVAGGIFTQLSGWRSVFVVLAAAGVLLTCAARIVLPAGSPRPEPLDLFGALQVSLGLAALVLGVSYGASDGWTVRTIIILTVAAAVLIAFIAHEGRTQHALLPLAILKLPGVQTGAAAAFALYTAAVGLQFFAPLYLQQLVHYSPLLSGLALVPLSATIFATSYVAGPLLARSDPKWLLSVGLTFVALGVGSWTFTDAVGHYATQMLPGLLIAGVGIGLVFPVMTSVALRDAPPETHALAGAVNVTAQQLGASIGVLALVLVATATAIDPSQAEVLAGYHVAYEAAALFCLLTAGGCWLRVGTRQSRTVHLPGPGSGKHNTTQGNNDG